MPGPTLTVHLPRCWFSNDTDGILTAFIALLDRELGRTRAEIVDLARQRDPARCDPEFLPVIARSRGWALDTSLPVPLQRKIVVNLAAMYRRRGRTVGIVEALRLVLGIEARVTPIFAGAWRLGLSPLGGIFATYTATGGESEIDLATVNDRWRHTPDMPGLRVLRNGTIVPRWRYLMPGATRLRFVTRGAQLFTYAPFATQVDLPFHYTPGGEHLAVWFDGRRAVRGRDYTEAAGESPNQIDLPSPLPVSTEVIVRTDDALDTLTAGDLIVAITEESNPLLSTTTLGPDLSDPTSLVQVRIEFPRPLNDDESRAALQIIDFMKSSLAVPVEQVSAFPLAKWRLGRSRLGLETRLR